MRRGPAGRFALAPVVLVAFIGAHSEHVTDGIPRRRRLTINHCNASPNDVRIIRRWRSGSINGVTTTAAAALLGRYGLGLDQLEGWSRDHDLQPVLRGGQLTIQNQGAHAHGH